jgi:hypothetical protein
MPIERYDQPLNLLDLGQLFMQGYQASAQRAAQKREADRQDRQDTLAEKARSEEAKRREALFGAIKIAKETGDTSAIHQIDYDLGLKYDKAFAEKAKARDDAGAAQAEAAKRRAQFEFSAARRIRQNPAIAPELQEEADALGVKVPGEHLLTNQNLAGPQILPDVEAARAKAESLGVKIDGPSAMDLRDKLMGSSPFKAAQEVQTAWEKIRGAPANAAGDISVLYGFMKLQDPTSTVREGEYATAENAQGIPEWVRAQYNKLVDGHFLGGRQRSQFINEAGRLYEGQKKSIEGLLESYRGFARDEGLRADTVVPPVFSDVPAPAPRQARPGRKVVPAKDRAMIIHVFTARRGKAPTEEEITEWYDKRVAGGM